MQVGYPEISAKELSVVKGQVTKSLEAAIKLTVKTREDLEMASSLLAKIYEVGKLVRNTRNSITYPLLEATRNVRQLFAPIEINYAEAENMVRRKMVEFSDAENRKAEEKRGKIAEKVEKGEMSFTKGAEKIEKIQPANGAGPVHFREIKDVQIEDESQLPREYLIPDMVKIRADALAGKEIPGVKVVTRKTTVVRGNGEKDSQEKKNN